MRNWSAGLTFTCGLGLLGALTAASACSGAASSNYSADAPPPGSSGSSGSSGSTQGGSPTQPSAGQCTPCTTASDCASGDVCAQFQGDTFCAPQCPNGDECGSGTTCSLESSYSGEQVSACVPSGNACGSPVGPVSDGGAPTVPSGCDAGAVTTCGSMAGPTQSASCHGCGSHTCQTNGCYGGWWCDTQTSKCQAPPTSCPAATTTCGGSSGGGSGSSGGSGGSSGGGSSSSGGTPIDVDAGGPVTGTVGENGGTVSRLYFTAVGDTRPANEDDTAGYPTTIIDTIYSDIAGLSPAPLFSLSTGDYQFSNPSGTESSTQMGYYMAARAKFAGTFFPALGNHECTGATASNCGTGNTNGLTTNYNNFMSLMLGPIHKTSPYYAININAADGSWTSKFVFVAANAWDGAQSSWLSGVMAQATTYTFVVRHESTGTSGPPGVSPSDTIINGFPFTLLVVGHTHSYGHPRTNEVLFGNGGAPITGSATYGFGLFSQRSDGAIVVDAIDYQTKQGDSSFHFVVTPTGTLTQ